MHNTKTKKTKQIKKTDVDVLESNIECSFEDIYGYYFKFDYTIETWVYHEYLPPEGERTYVVTKGGFFKIKEYPVMTQLYDSRDQCVMVKDISRELRSYVGSSSPPVDFQDVDVKHTRHQHRRPYFGQGRRLGQWDDKGRR